MTGPRSEPPIPTLITLRMRLPVCPFHSPAYPICKIGHPVEYGMDLGNDVLTVHNDGGLSRCSQGSMQNSSLLGDVDLLSAKHGFDSIPEARFLCQFDQQFQSLVRDAILRVVEINAQRLDS